MGRLAPLAKWPKQKSSKQRSRQSEGQTPRPGPARFPPKSCRFLSCVRYQGDATLKGGAFSPSRPPAPSAPRLQRAGKPRRPSLSQPAQLLLYVKGKCFPGPSLSWGFLLQKGGFIKGRGSPAATPLAVNLKRGLTAASRPTAFASLRELQNNGSERPLYRTLLFLQTWRPSGR